MGYSALKKWKSIAINQDSLGKMLLNGHHTMTALALGMMAED